MVEIRIAWKIEKSHGHGLWHPVGCRESFLEEIKALCAEYGEGTHWLEERKAEQMNDNHG